MIVNFLILALHSFPLKQKLMNGITSKRISKFCFLIFFPMITSQAQDVHIASSNPLILKPNEVVDFGKLNVANIKEATQSYIQQVKESNKRIISVSDANRTFENTLGELDLGAYLLAQPSSIYEVVFSAHPDKDIRDAASASFQELANLSAEQDLNEDLYKAVKAYALKAEAKMLTGERKHFLEKLLRDFQNNGFALTADKRDTLKALNNKLLDLSIKFSSNIAQDNPTIVFSESEMEGVSMEFKKSHKQADGSYKLDVSNPSYVAFMSYAKSAEARRRFYLTKTNVAAPANDKLLVEILSLRTRKAKLLGHSSYANYATESIMSKNPKNVWDFETKLQTDLRPKAIQDYNNLLKLKSTETGKKETIIFPFDNMYYTTQLLDKTYKVDEEEVKQYFELQNVIKGLFDVYQRIYNLSFVEDKHPSVWHPDVQAFSVTDNVTNKNIGYFYLDLYPRDNKYKHAACFPITASHTVASGRQIASAALICNFPKPTADQPSLMTHSNVVTIFHEFGHLMHSMVNETELSSFAGTNVVTDFVEAPSQIMENWVWNKEVLSLFAKHYKTGAVIPADLVDRMIASKNATSGLTALQQVFYGTFDFTLNDGFLVTSPNAVADLIKKLQNSITLFPWQEGSHFEASFGHLTNYASEYYGYLWSLVYAQDMYSVFAANPLSPETGARFRKMVLAKGGSDDALTLVRNFLGREPNNSAFLKNLGLSPSLKK
jgi:thimet oligopeptidase